MPFKGGERRWRNGSAFLVLFGALACRFGPAQPADEACARDRDCAGTRICEQGRCVDSRPSEPRSLGGQAEAPTPPPVSDAQWRRGGPGGPHGVLGNGPLEPPKMVWDVELGAVVFARPTLLVRDGATVAYVGTHAGRFVGVRAEGPRAGTIDLDLHLGGIVWSTAATDGQRLYVGADDDTLYAIDPRTRTIAWRKRLGDCEPPRAPGPEGTRCDVDGGPTVAPDGDLYVGVDGVYRLSVEGEVKWHWPAGDRGKHGFSAPRVTADGLVVFGGHDGRITALSTDGTLLWQYEVGADVDASAVVGLDGTIVIGADDGRVHALSRDGELRWAFVTQKDIRSAITVGGDGSIYVGSFDGNLYGLHPDGNPRWILPTGGRIAATPTIDPAGTIFCGSQDENLYALTSDGRVLWTVEFPAQIDSTVAITTDGTIVVGADDGHLRGLR